MRGCLEVCDQATIAPKFFDAVFYSADVVWQAAGSALVLSVDEVKADEPPHDRLDKFLDGCQVNTPNGVASWLARIHLREKGY
jgi:hypothetical protein